MPVQGYRHATRPCRGSGEQHASYAGLIENGVANVDWLEMHSTFLDSGENPQGPYYAIQLVHTLTRPGDKALAVTNSSKWLTGHVTTRTDGSYGVLLINKDPLKTAVVTVSLIGANPRAGTMYTWQQNSTTAPISAPISGLGSTFTVSVPAYGIVGYVIH
jgi:hypothetical protein